jgi:hypothetical protein
VTTADLQSWLGDFLASKAPPRTAGSSTQAGPAERVDPWAGMQLALDHAPAAPAPATATAPPAVEPAA